jgi:UDP-N-acetylglucosamine acyltransferase
VSVHPTAIVSDQAEIHPEASIGPFVIIAGKVKIGAGTKVEAHACIGFDTGSVTIGQGNHIWQGAVVGGPPQDLKYNGEPVSLVIGNNNQIREYVTLSCGTGSGGGVTRIGKNCLFMAYSHIGHDCVVGDRAILANSVALAGHVELDDYVTIGGISGVTQFCKLGKYVYVGGHSSVNKDILPFTMVQGSFGSMRGTNKIGMQRAGFSPEEISAVNKAVRFVIKGNRTKSEALELIRAECGSFEAVAYLTTFFENSKKGVAI